MAVSGDADTSSNAVSNVVHLSYSVFKGPTTPKRTDARTCMKPSKKTKQRRADSLPSTKGLAKMKKLMEAHFQREPASNGTTASR